MYLYYFTDRRRRWCYSRARSGSIEKLCWSDKRERGTSSRALRASWARYCRVTLRRFGTFTSWARTEAFVKLLLPFWSCAHSNDHADNDARLGMAHESLCCRSEATAHLARFTCVLRPRQKIASKFDGLVHLLRVLRGAVWIYGTSASCGQSFLVCLAKWSKSNTLECRLLLCLKAFLEIRYRPPMGANVCLSKQALMGLPCTSKDGSRNARPNFTTKWTTTASRKQF